MTIHPYHITFITRKMVPQHRIKNLVDKYFIKKYGNPELLKIYDYNSTTNLYHYKVFASTVDELIRLNKVLVDFNSLSDLIKVHAGSPDQISELKILDLKGLSSVSIESSTNEHDDYFSLYFPINDFSNEEIAEIMSLMSELYQSVSGDILEIKGTSSTKRIHAELIS